MLSYESQPPFEEGIDNLIELGLKFLKEPKTSPFIWLLCNAGQGPVKPTNANDTILATPEVLSAIGALNVISSCTSGSYAYYLDTFREKDISSFPSHVKNLLDFCLAQKPVSFDKIIFLSAVINEALKKDDIFIWEKSCDRYNPYYANNIVIFNITNYFQKELLAAYCNLFNFPNPLFKLDKGDPEKIFKNAFKAGMFTTLWLKGDVWRNLPKRDVTNGYIYSYRNLLDPKYKPHTNHQSFLWLFTISKELTETFLIEILQNITAPNTFFDRGCFRDGLYDTVGSAELKRASSQIVYDAVIKVRPFTNTLLKVVSYIEALFEDFDGFVLELHKAEMAKQGEGAYYEARIIREAEELRPERDKKREVLTNAIRFELTKHWLSCQKIYEEACEATCIWLYENAKEAQRELLGRAWMAVLTNTML